MVATYISFHVSVISISSLEGCLFKFILSFSRQLAVEGWELFLYSGYRIFLNLSFADISGLSFHVVDGVLWWVKVLHFLLGTIYIFFCCLCFFKNRCQIQANVFIFICFLCRTVLCDNLIWCLIFGSDCSGSLLICVHDFLKLYTRNRIKLDF